MPGAFRLLTNNEIEFSNGLPRKVILWPGVPPDVLSSDCFEAHNTAPVALINVQEKSDEVNSLEFHPTPAQQPGRRHHTLLVGGGASTVFVDIDRKDDGPLTLNYAAIDSNRETRDGATFIQTPKGVSAVVGAAGAPRLILAPPAAPAACTLRPPARHGRRGCAVTAVASSGPWLALAFSNSEIVLYHAPRMLAVAVLGGFDKHRMPVPPPKRVMPKRVHANTGKLYCDDRWALQTSTVAFTIRSLDLLVTAGSLFVVAAGNAWDIMVWEVTDLALLSSERVEEPEFAMQLLEPAAVIPGDVAKVEKPLAKATTTNQNTFQNRVIYNEDGSVTRDESSSELLRAGVYRGHADLAHVAFHRHANNLYLSVLSDGSNGSVIDITTLSTPRTTTELYVPRGSYVIDDTQTTWGITFPSGFRDLHGRIPCYQVGEPEFLAHFGVPRLVRGQTGFKAGVQREFAAPRFAPPYTCGAVSKQGLLAVGTIFGSVYVFNMDCIFREATYAGSNAESLPHAIFHIPEVWHNDRRAGGNEVSNLAFSPDGALLAAGTDGRRVFIFDSGALRWRGRAVTAGWERVPRAQVAQVEEVEEDLDVIIDYSEDSGSDYVPNKRR